MLHEFVTVNRDELIRRCRTKVAGRSDSSPRGRRSITESRCFWSNWSARCTGAVIERGDEPERHSARPIFCFGVYPVTGRARLRRRLSVDHGTGGGARHVDQQRSFRVLNGCLDNAIAGRSPGKGASRIVRSRRETLREKRRLGFFTHELRNLIHTADGVRRGQVRERRRRGKHRRGAHRSLVGARDLIARSLAEVRVRQGIQHREPMLVAGFIEELTSAARAARINAKGITFTVMPVEDGVAIEADRQVLASVVTNILQNAFKFTRPRTKVTLRAGASAERVLIEIQDECGGLPSGDANELFRPFEQRSTNRTGLGLGLAFSRSAVEANHGRIYARNLPDSGCIFTIDLPRHLVSAVVIG